MMDRRRDDDLDLIEDDATLAAVDAVRAAYVADELPRVGIQLAEVFSNGLPDQGVPSGPVAEPPVRTEKRRRLVPSKALVAGLGAAVLSVNLVAVGSAGWLPEPLQRSFEKVTRSIGVDVPAPGATDRRPAPRQGGPSSRGETGTESPTGGGTRGQSGSSGSSPQDPPPTGQRPDQREPRDGRQGGTPAPASNSPGATATSVPTSRPAPGRGADSPGQPGTTVPCAPATAPARPPVAGPAVPTLPTVPTTVQIPIAGDAVGGVPGPPGTLPVTPPDCPR